MRVYCMYSLIIIYINLFLFYRFYLKNRVCFNFPIVIFIMTQSHVNAKVANKMSVLIC